MDTPDQYIGWVPLAVLRESTLIRRERIAVLHASGPPFSVVLAGALLARLTGVPLVSDFRDAWTLDPGDPFGTVGGTFRSSRSQGRLRLLRALERWCISCSTAVLFTSRATRSLYVTQYPELKGRAHVIYNGVDLADFRDIAKSLQNPTIAHVGTLHEFQLPQVEFFLTTASTLLTSGALPSNTEIVFAGSIGDELKRRLVGITERLQMGRILRLEGFVPHARAVALMLSSRLLLLFAGENPYFRPSKISEYIAAGSPILAFAATGSETAEEVRMYGGTVVTDWSSTTVELALADIAHSRPRRLPDLEHPHRLNRRTEAIELATLLDEFVEISRPA